MEKIMLEQFMNLSKQIGELGARMEEGFKRQDEKMERRFKEQDNKMIESSEEKNLIIFCKTPRTRNEICHYLGINSVSYVMKKYVMPLVERGILKMSIPDKPKSTKQLFYCE